MNDFDFPAPADLWTWTHGTTAVTAGQITGVRRAVGLHRWETVSLPEPVRVEAGDLVVTEWGPDGVTVRVDRGAT